MTYLRHDPAGAVNAQGVAGRPVGCLRCRLGCRSDAAAAAFNASGDAAGNVPAYAFKGAVHAVQGGGHGSCQHRGGTGGAAASVLHALGDADGVGCAGGLGSGVQYVIHSFCHGLCSRFPAAGKLPLLVVHPCANGLGIVAADGGAFIHGQHFHHGIA